MKRRRESSVAEDEDKQTPRAGCHAEKVVASLQDMRHADEFLSSTMSNTSALSVRAVYLYWLYERCLSMFALCISNI